MLLHTSGFPFKVDQYSCVYNIYTLCIYNIYTQIYIHFLHLATDGHLDGFRNLTIVNNASFGYIPRGAMLIFFFFEEFVFHSAYTILHSYK